MKSDMWATSLPCDLLLDIFRRLGSTAVIRCAGVCRPWRRAIIDNAARCLRPRPDCFLPDLLLAFFDYYCHLRQHTATIGRRPEHVVPSAENVLALESVVDVGPYDRPLASRDGFLLLKVWDEMLSKSLCLCNILAGSCRFLSIPAVNNSSAHPCSYVLATAYDDDDDDDDSLPDGSSAVRILAARGEGNWVTYQIFSSTSGGVWGPVKRSAKLVDEDLAKVCVFSEPRHAAVVCGGGPVAYWLVNVMSFAVDEEEEEEEEGDSHVRTCLFAMDTRTERTWTTELPEEYTNDMDSAWDELVLATSDDGRRLSLVASKSQGVQHEIEVWVLAAAGDDDSRRWSLQRTIDMPNLGTPYVASRDQFWFRCFCPRSGCLLANATDQKEFLIGVDGSSPRLIETATDPEFTSMLQYEMDWSTYVSKMKYF